MGQVHAVEARKILDLRLGAAFTRMQTLNLRQRLGDRLSELISYGESWSTFVSPSAQTFPGPCQFPTLGFVVSRYNQVKSFVPETFWYMFLSVMRQQTSKDRTEVVFTSRRGHIFDFETAAHIYEGVVSNPLARVTKVTNKDTKKWYRTTSLTLLCAKLTSLARKPLPLTTVELQKSGSRLLYMAPKKLLDVSTHFVFSRLDPQI
jgi:DNA topoisomerase III